MAVVTGVDVDTDGKLASRRVLARKNGLLTHIASTSIGRHLGILVLLAILAFLTLYPLSMLFYGSLHSTPPGMVGEFNLDGYRQILTNCLLYTSPSPRDS